MEMFSRNGSNASYFISSTVSPETTSSARGRGNYPLGSEDSCRGTDTPPRRRDVLVGWLAGESISMAREWTTYIQTLLHNHSQIITVSIGGVGWKL